MDRGSCRPETLTRKFELLIEKPRRESRSGNWILDPIMKNQNHVTVSRGASPNQERAPRERCALEQENSKASCRDRMMVTTGKRGHKVKGRREW
jgi:hypothetical protein